MPRNQRKRTYLSTSRPPNREQRRDQARRAGFFGLPLTQCKPSKVAGHLDVHRRTPFAKRFPAVNTPYVTPVSA